MRISALPYVGFSVGSLHGPSLATVISTFFVQDFDFITQSFGYWLPSLPQTGLYINGHAWGQKHSTELFGRALHSPYSHLTLAHGSKKECLRK